MKIMGEIDLFAGIRVGKTAAKIDASIIHAHTALAHTMGIFAKSVCSAKLIVTRRVDFPLKTRGFSHWKYKRADHIIAISENIKQIMLKAGIDETKISLVPSGVAFNDLPEITNKSVLKSQLGIDTDHKIIGTIAAFVGHKDYPTLLRAFRIVLNQYPQVWLLSLGEGKDRRQLEKLAKSLNIDHRLKFLGFRTDVIDFFLLFDVYAQASRLEGLCTSLIEAMYHRLPIAATSAGGIPDLIEHNVTGLLSPPEDYEKLADSIIRLLNEPKLGARLAEAAHLKSLNFTADNMVKRTEQLYMKLLL